MMSWKISYLVFIFVMCCLKLTTVHALPEEKSGGGGGFSFYLGANPGQFNNNVKMKNAPNYFSGNPLLNNNPNISNSSKAQGDFNTGTSSPLQSYFVIGAPPQQLDLGDNSWPFKNSNGFLKSLQNKNFDNPFKIGCVKASTVINGGMETCVGESIIQDDFNNVAINSEAWVVQHMIPTYSKPNFEFNTYENNNETRFVRNGLLHLKPIPVQSEEEVRGELNLRNGCTSKVDIKCYYRQRSSFLLPPVRSAKITSKSTFKYGKIEIRAKLPAGDWIFPIIQLEPKDNDNENLTTIWIAYSRGNDYLEGIEKDDIGSRLLLAGPVLDPIEPGRSSELVKKRSPNLQYNSDFRVYTLNWEPGKMMFSVDSEEYGTVNLRKNFEDSLLETLFDREYVLSLGVGVGGINDFPDGYTAEDNTQKPWSNEERNQVKKFFDARSVWSRTWTGDNPALKVDYVKVTAV